MTWLVSGKLRGGRECNAKIREAVHATAKHRGATDHGGDEDLRAGNSNRLFFWLCGVPFLTTSEVARPYRKRGTHKRGHGRSS